MATIASLDESIGKMLDYLKKEGLLDNTIIVYCSDQGFYVGEHGWFDKRFMYEESMKMPMMMRFPENQGRNTYHETDTEHRLRSHFPGDVRH